MSAPFGATHRACLGAALVSLLGGCSSWVDNPSAYDSELFLCGPEQAERWQSELASCRSDHARDSSCAGVVSFTGMLQGQPITVDSRLDLASFDDLSRADGTTVRSELKLTGVSPYFRFRFRLWEIGGGVPAAGDRTLRVLAGRPPGADSDPNLDDFVRIALRLSASSQSQETSAADGTLAVTLQTELEQAAEFHLELGADAIDGCFHALATERNLTSALP